MKTEIMIDIETLAVPEELPRGYVPEVVEIGAVKFRGDEIIDELPLLFPAEGNGLCTAETVTFWFQQVLGSYIVGGPVRMPQWVYERVQAESPEALPSMGMCLQMLTDFIGYDPVPIWSKGKFDLNILWSHYGAKKLVCPWKYYQCRDLRTMMKECGVAGNYEDVAHDALVDARDQVGYLAKCRERFSGEGAA